MVSVMDNFDLGVLRRAPLAEATLLLLSTRSSVLDRLLKRNAGGTLHLSEAIWSPMRTAEGWRGEARHKARLHQDARRPEGYALQNAVLDLLRAEHVRWERSEGQHERERDRPARVIGCRRTRIYRKPLVFLNMPGRT
jgi:hypothetical protein